MINVFSFLRLIVLSISNIFFYLLGIVGGLALLMWSADRLVAHATTLALKFKISPLVIGMTVIALGTSLPELVVSLIAAIEGSPALSIGNAIGSNIANIGCVFGLSLILLPGVQLKKNIDSSLLVLLLVTGLALFCIFDLFLGLFDGLLLLGTLLCLCCLLWYQKNAVDLNFEGAEESGEDNTSSYVLWGWLLVDILLLVVSAELLVWCAREVALIIGLSDLVIGLTIVAVGTSLPELAATYASLKALQPDLAVGNILGSNVINLLLIMGVPGMINPTNLDTSVFWRDGGFMFLLTLVFAVSIWLNKKQQFPLGRPFGLSLFCSWIGYNIVLVNGAL